MRYFPSVRVKRFVCIFARARVTFHSKTCVSSLSLSPIEQHIARVTVLRLPDEWIVNQKKSRAMKLSLSVSPMTRERIAPPRAPSSTERQRETEREETIGKNKRERARERSRARAMHKNIASKKGAPETRSSRLSSTNPRWRECRRTNRTAT